MAKIGVIIKEPGRENGFSMMTEAEPVHLATGHKRQYGMMTTIRDTADAAARR